MVASIYEKAGIGLLEIIFGKGANLIKFTRRDANGQDKEE